MRYEQDPITGLLVPARERPWVPRRVAPLRAGIVGPAFFSGGDAQTKILFHFDGPDASTSIVDSSIFARTFTGGATCRLSTAQSKFGGSSLHMTDLRNDNLLSIPSTADFARSGDTPYGLDFWMYHVSTPSSTGSPIIMNVTGLASGIFVFSNYATTLRQTFNLGGGAIGPQASPGPSNQWVHVYFGHDPSSSGGYAVCLDGVPITGLTFSGSVAGWTGATASVSMFGQSGIFSNPCNVYIDEFRFVVGRLPYPLTGFAPPTEPYVI